MNTILNKNELIQIHVIDNLNGLIFFRKNILIFLLAFFCSGLQAQPEIDFLNQGRSFHDAGDWQNAYLMYSQALGLQPNMPEALFNRAECLLQMDDHEAAIEDLNLLLLKSPNDIQAIERRGVAEFYQEHWMAAAQDFSQVLMKEESVDLLLNRAIAYLELEQFQLALIDLEKCESYEPSNRRLQAVFGDYYLKKKDRLKARNYYKKALLFDENNAEVLNNLGYLEIQNENYREAEKHFKKAISINPNNRIYAHLALAQMKTGNFIEAMDNVALALEPDSNEPLAFFVKGRFSMENGNPKKAIENFDTAIELDPNYMPAYLQRAKAKWAANMLEPAKEDLKKVLELAPENEEAQKLLRKE